MIYYRALFDYKKGLSSSEGIVYSVLLSHSLLSYAEAFDTDGKFNIKNAKELIKDTSYSAGFEAIYYEKMSISKLAEKVEMTRPAVRKILADLKTKGAIKDGFIRCPLRILEKGFMKLPPKTKLKGSQLTFYALLLERSRRYNGTIDTWASRLAKLAGITKTNAQSIINILEKKGFLKRLENGKLLVL